MVSWVPEYGGSPDSSACERVVITEHLIGSRYAVRSVSRYRARSSGKMEWSVRLDEEDTSHNRSLGGEAWEQAIGSEQQQSLV